MQGTLLSSEHQIEKIVRQVEELALLPHVVFKVLELSASEMASMADLEKAIIVDPAFSTRVLTIANSAAFSLPRRVSSIREALMLVGCRTIRNISLTAGLFDLFAGKNDAASLRRRQWWRHSIDSAVVAAMLGSQSRLVAPDEVYACGLLHNLGKNLIDRFATGDYGQVLERVEAGTETVAAEREVYGFDHCQVGTSAARKWGLTEVLVAGLDYVEARGDGHDIYRACTNLASLFASEAQGVSVPDSAWPTWALSQLKFDASDLPQLSDSASEAMAAGQMHLQ